MLRNSSVLRKLLGITDGSMSMWNPDYSGGNEDSHPVGAPTRGKKSVPGVADVYTGECIIGQSATR